MGPFIKIMTMHVDTQFRELRMLSNLMLYLGQAAKPQLLLFSATIPDWVSRTASKYMNKNKKIVDMIGQDKVKTAIAVEVCREYDYVTQVIIFCCSSSTKLLSVHMQKELQR